MKSYKDFEKKTIGASDIAQVVYRSADQVGIIKFVGDGSYRAYIVDDDAEIADHYQLVAQGESWLRIYDDEGISWSCGWNGDANSKPRAWKIFRGGEYGCIIQLIY